MTVFVLVHGAWGGAHGFRKVRGPLLAAGHEVFTPSLTGIGERAHLTSPQVGLSTHIADVVNTVWYEDLSDIVLLGFSYGGFVVTGALAYIAERVRHLVYLDAFVPGDGDSVASLTGIAAGFSGTGHGVIGLGRDWLVPPVPRELDDPAETAWADARRTPQPVGCFTEPVRLARPLEDYPFTRTYIKATGEPRPSGPGPGGPGPGGAGPGGAGPGGAGPGGAGPGGAGPGGAGSGASGSGGAFWAAADRAMASPAWSYHEITTNHMIPSNRPEELARLLLALA